MRPRLIVYAPASLPVVEVPEFDVEWRTFDVDVSTFIDPPRGQCGAERAVKALARRERYPTVYVLNCDGYYPGLSYVFGLAIPKVGTAVVFTARLLGERFEERLAKEITHEAGHLYGLGHCGDPHCVMYFSNSLLDTDRKSQFFCPRCRLLLQKANQPTRL
ncbi:MAG: archemetzincin [Pyrobaculum sp.]